MLLRSDCNSFHLQLFPSSPLFRSSIYLCVYIYIFQELVRMPKPQSQENNTEIFKKKKKKSKMAYDSSSSGKSMQEKTLTGVGNLIRLLPTGTVFMFQFLNPVLTNNGHCTAVNKWLAGALIAVCGFSCGFSSFTDSYTDDQGQTHYGVATTKGLWPSPAAGDWSAFRIRLGDFVHAAFTMMVFGVLVLLDRNTVDCYYPAFESTQKVLLMAMPPVIGAISGSVFMMFPNRRHGIGYPQEQDDDNAK